VKDGWSWHSERLQRWTHLVRWGHWGTPVLLLPTAGGDAEECERFLMIDALRPLIDAGRIKVYSFDSIAGRAWIDREGDPIHRAWVQNQFHHYVRHEVVPAIWRDCHDQPLGIVTAGASIGAFNACGVVCRFPDVFTLGICMSGTYDLEPWLDGQFTLDFFYASPLHFVPQLHENGHLELLRRRFILLPTGEGRWENPDQTWRMAHVLGSRHIPNRVDLWGPHYEHDWPTWRDMLPHYLNEMADAARIL
jgi:esterase/lipase superfamily enzyme